jgi:hypothetical protein
MDWIISGLSLIVIWTMGNKSWYAPFIGIFSQVFWVYYALSLKQYGLLIATIGYLFIHIRNAYKWNVTDKKEDILNLTQHKCELTDLKIDTDYCDGLFDITLYRCRKCGKTGIRSDFNLDN